MVLVDTSVFISYFKKSGSVPCRKMRHLIDNDLPYGICNYVYQELLQGALNKNEFDLLKDYLEPLARRGGIFFGNVKKSYLGY